MTSRGDELAIETTFTVIGWLFRLAWWLVGRIVSCVVWLVRHPVMLGMAAVVYVVTRIATSLPYGGWILGGFVLALVVGTYVLGVKWPEQYERFVAHPIRCLWHRYLFQRMWQPAMVTSGLTVKLNGELVFPRILSFDSLPLVDLVRVSLPMGQIFEDWARAVEQLRTTFEMEDVRIHATDVPSQLVIAFMRGNLLEQPVPPLEAPEPALDNLPVGKFENGNYYGLSVLDTHILLGGASGAGKSSAVWSMISGLAPLIKQGAAQLWAFDPKGGVELWCGRPLFHRFFHGNRDTSFEQEAAAGLEELVDVMHERQERIRGVARRHTASPDDPHIVVIIDELAALTSYTTERDAAKRFATALKLLLSQGRACGITVIGAVQDPRKETVPMRDLFPTRLGLRMTEPEQVDMVLGDGARRAGALCDKIPQHLKGVAYVKTDDDPAPHRFRFSYYSDDDIDDLVRRYGRQEIEDQPEEAA